MTRLLRTCILMLLLATPMWGHARAIQTPQGTFEFSATEGRDARGRREVVFSLEEKHRLSPDLRVPVLRGRDTDFDGILDAWFYTGEDGLIEAMDLPAGSLDGWEAAEKVITERLHTKSRWFISVLLSATISHGVTPSLSSSAGRFLRSITARQIELRELEIQTARLQRQGGVPQNELTALHMESANGWEEVARRFDRQIVRDRIVPALVDVASWASGLIVFRYVGPWLARIAPRLGAVEIVQRFTSAIVRQAERARGLVPTRVITQPIRQFGTRIATRAESAAVSLEARGQAGRAAATGLRTTADLGWQAVNQSSYIATNVATQITIELLTRRKAFLSGDPIIIESNADEMKQNVAYMGLETVLQTSIQTRFKAQPVKGLGYSALVSTVDSNFMNFAIKGEADLGRNAIDTGWEAVIGNGQTFIDAKMMDLFKQQALARSTPGLKLLGFVFVVADQSLGYWGYNQVTQAYNNGTLGDAVDKLRVLVTPVYVKEKKPAPDLRTLYPQLELRKDHLPGIIATPPRSAGSGASVAR